MFFVLICLFMYSAIAGFTLASYKYFVKWVCPEINDVDVDVSSAFAAIFWPLGLPMIIFWGMTRLLLVRLGVK